MNYRGDYPASAVVTFGINTVDKTNGAPITLAGTPVAKVYKDTSSTTEVTTGVTLTVDFDAATGSHLVSIDTSSDGTFYAAGHDYTIRLTAGTVDGVSVVGSVLGSFSIENRSVFKAADRTTLGAAATATALAAVSTQVTNLNNLSALANLYAPQVMEIPDAGSTTFPFILTISDAEGHLVDLDANAVTLTATNSAGTDRSANLSSVAHTGTGKYTFTYAVASTATREAIMFTASGAVSSSARFAPAIVDVVDYDSTTAIAAIKAKTDQLTFTASNKVDATAVTVSDKTGYALTSGERDSIADALLDRTDGVETGITPRKGLRGLIAAAFGKLSGAATTAVVIRNPGDTKDRITATVDASGNRSAVSTDLT